MATSIALTPAMLCMFTVLATTIYLFISEIVRIDVAAILIMVLLGLLTQVPGLEQIIDVTQLFSGFASNAVMSIVAIMIIGAGLDKTGLMGTVANWIIRMGKHRERRVTLLISTSAALISTFVQNVGAAALLLPVVSRVAVRTGIAPSRLMMPMGFCVILGGTVTMVGSSPLILLNDLLAQSRVLVDGEHIAEFHLFAVAPVGLALSAVGIAYFVIAGRWVLPAIGTKKIAIGGSRTTEYFKQVYGLEADIFELRVPMESRLAGRRIDVAERAGRVRIIAYSARGEKRIAPAGSVEIEAGAIIGVMAGPEALKRFIDNYKLEQRPQLRTFADALMFTSAGISEVVIPPNSKLIGKTVRDLRLRVTYGLSALGLHRGGKTIMADVRDTPLQAGDTLVCHSSWDMLAQLERDRDFVVVTSNYPHEELRPQKVTYALAFLAIALGLELFSDVPLAVALLVGAMGMIISGVLTIDEAYSAVSWKTVFLLASLIPLGQAMENSGAAAWIASQILILLDGVPIWVLQTVLALMATVFSLLMSNVGATVMMVPLAINIATRVDADPAVFALIVTMATANAFLIPTNQVNALIIGPGGYRTKDFIFAGGILTLLFLPVMLLTLNWLY